MPLNAGTKLGLYEIVGPIGVGGMGEVYRAVDTKLAARLRSCLRNSLVILPGWPALNAKPMCWRR